MSITRSSFLFLSYSVSVQLNTLVIFNRNELSFDSFVSHLTWLTWWLWTP